MRLRTLSMLLSQSLSHLPGAEYERAKCEALAAQVQEQRSHIEDLARRLEYTTRQKDEAEEAHVDAYEIRLDKIEGERDAWQRSHGTLAREKEQLKVELHTLRARVVELQAGEPVAWICKYEGGPVHLVGNSLLRDVHHSQGAKTEPLFRSQPAAPAYGVEGELFVCWKGACMWLTDDDGEGARDTGTRAEVEARAKKIAGSRVMRLVDADAPVVDVAKIREVVADLGASYPRLFASESAHLLRVAIGEKA